MYLCMYMYMYSFWYIFYPLSDLTVFGVTLELAIQRSLLGTDGIELPTVFRLCIDYLEENGKSQHYNITAIAVTSKT